jgi:hypothetical protein
VDLNGMEAGTGSAVGLEKIRWKCLVLKDTWRIGWFKKNEKVIGY